MRHIIGSILAIAGIILCIMALLSPLYFVIKYDEPLYLFLFIISPVVTGIIAQVVIALVKIFIEDF